MVFFQVTKSKDEAGLDVKFDENGYIYEPKNVFIVNTSNL